jgi:hypothetical protein
MKKQILFLLLLSFYSLSFAQFGKNNYYYSTGTAHYYLDASHIPYLVEDFDGDGYKDIIYIADKIMYVRKNVNNVFQKPQIIFQVNVTDPYLINFSQSNSFYSADMDADGDLDLAIVVNYTNSLLSYRQVILRNNGNFNFEFIDVANTTDVRYSFVDDVDRDGLPDLLCNANPYGNLNYLHYLHNLGNCTFETISAGLPYAYSTTPASMSMNIDGDSIRDILVYTIGWETQFQSSGVIKWFKNYNNDSLAYKDIIFNVYEFTQYPGQTIESVKTHDLNGDGIEDIYIYTKKYDVNVNVFYVMLGNGNGTFNSPVLLKSYSGIARQDFTIEDIDHDGKDDIVFKDMYLKYLGGFSFADLARVYPAVPGYESVSRFVSFKNIDIDSSEEVLFITPNDRGCSNDSFFVAKRNGGVMQVVTYTPIQYQPLTATTTFDYNHDSVPDILAAYYYDYCRNQGPKVKAVNLQQPLMDSAAILVTGSSRDYRFVQLENADLNNDGYNDLLIVSDNDNADPYYNKLLVSLNNHGSFLPPVLLDSFPGNHTPLPFIHTADMDGNGFMDVLVSQGYSSVGKPFLIYANNGNGTYTKNAILTPANGNYYRPFYACDMDSDGDTDIIAEYDSSGVGRLIVQLTNNGFPNFSKKILVKSPSINAFNHADFDKDGDEDIIGNFYGSFSDYTDTIFLNNNGNFQAAYVPSVKPVKNYASDPGLKIVDFDQDGFPDICFNTKTYINNHDLTFTPLNYFYSHENFNRFVDDLDNTQYLQIADYNRDGLNDILLNSYIADPTVLTWIPGYVSSLRPDLAIQSINAPAYVPKTDSFTVNIGLKNLGQDTLSYKLYYYLIPGCGSRNSFYNYTKIDSGSITFIAGGQVESASVKLKLAVTGTYYMVAYAMPMGNELNLSNNLSSCLTLTIQDSVSSGVVTLKSEGLQIQPNPFRNAFAITGKTGDIKEVEFFPVSGQKISLQIIRSESWLVNCGELPKGVYFISIRLKDGSVINSPIVKD